MDPSISEYVTEAAKWFCIGFGTYVGTLIGAQAFSLLSSERIRSQAELERAVKEEAEALGLDPSKIDANYGAPASGADKVGERYVLSLKSGFFGRRSSVAHELYHIRRGDCERPDGNVSGWYYFFVAEPACTFYELRAKRRRFRRRL